MEDLTRKQFGRLIVIRRMNNNKWGRSRWLCKCECKQEKVILSYCLKSGHTQSCGCLNKEIITKHGLHNNKIYPVWNDMIQRCTNPKNKDYHNYGGRGIKVCKHWMKIENFLEDMEKGWKPGLQIERKNNYKGYHKENCKWATRKEQDKNKRNNLYIIYNGKTQLLMGLCEQHNVSYTIIWHRIYSCGWLPEKAFMTPVKKKRRK